MFWLEPPAPFQHQKCRDPIAKTHLKSRCFVIYKKTESHPVWIKSDSLAFACSPKKGRAILFVFISYDYIHIYLNHWPLRAAQCSGVSPFLSTLKKKWKINIKRSKTWWNTYYIDYCYYTDLGLRPEACCWSGPPAPKVLGLSQNTVQRCWASHKTTPRPDFVLYSIWEKGSDGVRCDTLRTCQPWRRGLLLGGAHSTDGHPGRHNTWQIKVVVRQANQGKAEVKMILMHYYQGLAEQRVHGIIRSRTPLSV